MVNKLAYLGLLLVGISLGGCANSNDVDRRAENQFVTEFYAYVKQVKKVRFKSYIGEGMAVGAIGGIIEGADGDKEDMLAGGIAGALVGGLFTAIFEGSSKGYEYQLQAVDGDMVTVIVSKKSGELGDCVSVRVAGDVRITQRPLENCIEAAKEYPLL
jgi:outer membrane lipoprotein SlyB